MNTIVRAIFDRKHHVEKKGTGAVEIFIRISKSKKYIVYKSGIKPQEWSQIEISKELADEIEYYKQVIFMMSRNNEAPSIDSFNSYLSKLADVEHPSTLKPENIKRVDVISATKSEPITKKPASGSVYDFIRNCILEENIKEGTRKHKETTLSALIEFRKFRTFSDLNTTNLKAFNKWLLSDKRRTEVTAYNYHKHLKKWCRLAYEARLIEESPYERVHFSRGKSKEREPLNEAELIRIRKLNLTGHLDRARDLFIFAAYTGLAYCDVMNFDYNTMTKNIGKQFYIDGSRIKTDSSFFTPILAPAMDILMKYNYKLPVMSNQKINDYMKVVAELAKIHTKVSFHVARHSFATLCLTYNVPIEDVARMLGHKDIKVTQIYAKILDATIHKQTQRLSSEIL